MKKSRSIFPFAAPSIALIAPLSAHAHHAEFMADKPFFQGLSMPVHGVDHLLSALAVGLIISLNKGRIRGNFMMLFALVAVLGGFLNLSGISLPEFAVPLTVLASGLALWNGVPSIFLGALLIGSAGLANGQALIENAPTNLATALFAMGCIFSAGLLTGVGVLVGNVLQTKQSFLRIAGAALIGGTAIITLFPSLNSSVLRIVE